jgi:hypothetical protein
VFGEYREVERRVQGAICQAFGLAEAMPAIVTLVDNRMLATERRDLMQGDRGEPTQLEWHGVEPYEDPISPWTQFRAETEFLRTFERLTSCEKKVDRP